MAVCCLLSDCVLKLKSRQMITRAGTTLGSFNRANMAANRLWSSKAKPANPSQAGRRERGLEPKRITKHSGPLICNVAGESHTARLKNKYIIRVCMYLPEPLYDGMVGTVAVLVHSVLSPVVDIHVTQTTHEQLQKHRVREITCPEQNADQFKS